MHGNQVATPRVWVQVDGHRISVLTAGAPNARPPVLALHGFGSAGAASWQRTGHLAALVAAGRYVIAPDLLGHGLSAAPTDPAAYSMAGLTRVAASAAGALGSSAGPIDLLGYSLGARICWELLIGSAQAGFAPRRAVLGGFDNSPPFTNVDVALLQHLLNPSSDPQSDPPARSSQPRSSPPRSREQFHHPAAAQTQRMADIIDFGEPSNRRSLLALVSALAGTDAGQGHPQQPILLVAGELDPIAAGVRELATELLDARYVQIPRRDHVSTVPAGAFRTAAAAFLAVEHC